MRLRSAVGVTRGSGWQSVMSQTIGLCTYLRSAHERSHGGAAGAVQPLVLRALIGRGEEVTTRSGVGVTRGNGQLSMGMHRTAGQAISTSRACCSASFVPISSNADDSASSWESKDVSLRRAVGMTHSCPHKSRADRPSSPLRRCPPAPPVSARPPQLARRCAPAAPISPAPATRALAWQWLSRPLLPRSRSERTRAPLAAVRRC